MFDLREEQGADYLAGVQAGAGPGLHPAPAQGPHRRQGVLDREEEPQQLEAAGQGGPGGHDREGGAGLEQQQRAVQGE